MLVEVDLTVYHARYVQHLRDLFRNLLLSYTPYLLPFFRFIMVPTFYARISNGIQETYIT